MTYLDELAKPTEPSVGHGVPLMSRRNRRVWLAKRRRVLGATDAVAVLGYSKFRTPLDVWGEKTGRWQPDDLTGKYVVERGNVLEALIIDEWVRRNDATRLHFPPLIGHPRHGFLAASLDALGEIDGRPTICEAKAVTWRTRSDWWDDAMLVPDQYAVQVLIQLAVTGLDTAHICADVAGEFTQVEIARDREFEAWALPALAQWWQRHVVGDEVPEVDPVRDYPRLNRVWRKIPGLEREATPDELTLIRSWRDASQKAREAKSVVDELRGHIRIALRDHEALTADGEQVVRLDARGALR